MARGDLSVVINSETKAFKQGVDSGIIKPLEDAEKALDDLGRSRGAENIERDMKAAQRATENLGKETKEVATRIEREFRDSYKKAGRAADEFQRDASGNVQNFKQEAVQNLSEVASSWKGDLEGMADGVQGLTGGLAASLTPGIGIPVAILGAAAAAFMASWVEAAEQSKQRVSDMYADMTESGATFLSESFIQQAAKTVAEDAGKFAEAQKIVADTGLEIGDVLRAMVGDQEAIARAQEIYLRQRDQELDKARELGSENSQVLNDQAVLVDAVNTKYAEQTDWLRQVQKDTDTAADKAQAVAEAIRSGNTEMDKLAAKWAGIPKSTQLGITINTSEFDRQFNELARKASAGIRVVLRPEQGRAWE